MSRGSAMGCDGRVSVGDAIASALPLRWVGMLSVASQQDGEARGRTRGNGVESASSADRFERLQRTAREPLRAHDAFRAGQFDECRRLGTAVKARGQGCITLLGSPCLSIVCFAGCTHAKTKARAQHLAVSALTSSLSARPCTAPRAAFGAASVILTTARGRPHSAALPPLPCWALPGAWAEASDLDGASADVVLTVTASTACSLESAPSNRTVPMAAFPPRLYAFGRAAVTSDTAQPSGWRFVRRSVRAGPRSLATHARSTGEQALGKTLQFCQKVGRHLDNGRQLENLSVDHSSHLLTPQILPPLAPAAPSRPVR